MGGNNARKLKKRHNQNVWADKQYKKKHSKESLNADPLEGASFAKGIVIEKIEEEAQSPSSGLRRGVKVQLIKNKRIVKAFSPMDGSSTFLDINDEVMICRRHGMGDLPKMKYQVVKVANVSLARLIAHA